MFRNRNWHPDLGHFLPSILWTFGIKHFNTSECLLSLVSSSSHQVSSKFCHSSSFSVSCQLSTCLFPSLFMKVVVIAGSRLVNISIRGKGGVAF